MIQQIFRPQAKKVTVGFDGSLVKIKWSRKRGKRTMNKYRGITYPKFLRGRIVHRLWKRFMCPRNRHLFDEVWSPSSVEYVADDHYLYCDACELEIHIKKIIE